ncbi:hypothetical protein HME9302_02094 [Alteripontixanthobacter maritimus]|uniref:DUF1643 domain-containing protein n=1 Tax=Alteripontixanthobacter maritimus TaxID=2161824 RepID=A0A369QF04_9SPHN|nr:DUF1643 domain-containing protein [Alteripontixanthobacter maritimus]RDC60878.1 hypothetical protein HME9302_02094 [Alteripontixanthobacter maritimus]
MITKADAILSDCENYRFFLERSWDDDLPKLPACMLNPSTGDADEDDPTIRRLTHFAKRWGYGGLAIVNLYPLRASEPSVMWASDKRSHDDNDQWLDAIIVVAKNSGNKLLIAWGNDGAWEGEADQFIQRVKKCSKTVELVTLGKTGHSNPRHPMARGRGRVADDQNMEAW